MMAGTVNRMDQFTQILKLDKDEKKQVKTIMDDAQKDAMPVRDQMEKGRLAIAEASPPGSRKRSTPQSRPIPPRRRKWPASR